MTGARILVTGSRRWRHPGIIRRELSAVAEWHGTNDITVVHGGAQGADLMADAYARRSGWTAEPHPANWEGPCRNTCRPGHRRPRGGTTYCPTAGRHRNQHMVNLGADICLAFVRDHSRGSDDCASRAEVAGIRVVRLLDCACHPTS